MKKKVIWSIVLALVVVGVCLGIFVTKRQKVTPVNQNEQSAVGLSIKKNKHSNWSDNQNNSQNQNQVDQYSTDEWMLMGYMSYAHDNYVESRHIKDNAALVNDVQEDLSDGNLEAEKNAASSYTLTNKFGSVAVEVDDDNVKVSGDGTIVNSKSELKEKFAVYSNKIKAMTKSISNSAKDSSDTSKNSNDKKRSSKTSNQSISHFSIAQLAVLAGFYRGTDESWVTDCVKNTLRMKDPNTLTGTMCYGYDKKTGNYYINGHGDATTNVIFKQKGNELVTKHNDLTGPSVGQSPMVTKCIPLSKLVAKYYSTSSQKAKVNDLAQKMLTQQQYDAKVKTLNKGKDDD